ncbi:Uncharacterised protein [Serratia proteamaculans]|nr:Uncharacterised protein [Serratia proteamaculans]
MITRDKRCCASKCSPTSSASAAPKESPPMLYDGLGTSRSMASRNAVATDSRVTCCASGSAGIAGIAAYTGTESACANVPKVFSAFPITPPIRNSGSPSVLSFRRCHTAVDTDDTLTPSCSMRCKPTSRAVG